MMHKLWFAGILLISVLTTVQAQAPKTIYGLKTGDWAPEIKNCAD
jgi:hypothetical protein